MKKKDDVDWGRIIKDTCQALGWTQDDMARELDCTLRTLSRYVNNHRNPSESTLGRLYRIIHEHAGAPGIPEFPKAHVPAPMVPNAEAREYLNIPEITVDEKRKRRTLRHSTRAPLQLWAGATKKILGMEHTGLQLYQVRDDAMEPQIKQNSFVILDPDVDPHRLRDGIYLCLLSGNIMLRRITPLAATLKFSALNPAYPELSLSKKELSEEDFRVLGHVKVTITQIG